MKIFTLEWEWWEDYRYYQFWHTDKTKDDFEKDVINLIKQCGDDYIDQERSWVGVPDWIEFVAEKLPELGYNKVEVDRVSFSGGYILKGEKDYLDSNGKPVISPDELRWKEIVGKKLFSKAVSKNRQLEEDMGRKRQSRKK